MSKEKMIPLKAQLGISDSEWKKIQETADEMHGKWVDVYSKCAIKEIEREKVKFINRTFFTESDRFETIQIYWPVLREVCGEKINTQFKQAAIQMPSADKKPEISVENLILQIRRLKQEEDVEFAYLDIKLVFWLVYSFMSGSNNQNVKDKSAEQKKEEERMKNICLYAACMELQTEEFSDLLNIIQYLTNHTLNAWVCHTDRTSFLGELCSGIILNTSDMEDNKDELKDTFKKYFDSKNTLIYVRTLEEKEIIKQILKIVDEDSEVANEIYCWDTSDGVVNLKTGIHREDAGILNRDRYTLGDAIRCVSEKLASHSDLKEIYIFRTIESGMKDADTVSKIKILTEKIRDKGSNVFLIFLAGDIFIDKTLEKYFHIDTGFYYPKTWKIREILEKFYKSKGIEAEKSILADIVYNCKGLTTMEIERALNLAYIETNQKLYKNAVLKFLQNEKKQSLEKSGLLELIEENRSKKDIGGLEELKEWLEKKSIIINNISSAREQHVPVPKGVLLIGMPGCGKSLCAKCAAGLFHVPLFRLDVGSILNKYVGESEHNFNDALLLAEAASPCVLWIDEMEKAFPDSSERGNQSEVSGKILGKFLTWMQEKKTEASSVCVRNI